jgi:hypothetical protein
VQSEHEVEQEARKDTDVLFPASLHPILLYGGQNLLFRLLLRRHQEHVVLHLLLEALL